MEQGTKRLTTIGKRFTGEVISRDIYGAHRVGERRTKTKQKTTKKGYVVVIGVMQKPIIEFADPGTDVSIMLKRQQIILTFRW